MLHRYVIWIPLALNHLTFLLIVGCLLLLFFSIYIYSTYFIKFIFSNYGYICVFLGKYCMGLYTCPTNLNRIVLLQKRAVRIVSKEAFNAHTDPVFHELKILKFEKKNLLHLVKFLRYSYKNNLLPRSFDDLFLRINDVHNYNPRNSNLYYAPFCRKKLDNLQLKCTWHEDSPGFFIIVFGRTLKIR